MYYFCDNDVTRTFGVDMKHNIAIALLLFISCALFAQADLQVLAIIKLNKNEPITLRQLKIRVESYQKQRGSPLNTEDRKKVLEAMIQEKLVIQAAANAGINVTDSMVDQYFLQSVSQSVGKQVTESEFAELIKQNTNMSLDDYMKQQSGMNVSEYKGYLKNQLIAQQYVVSQKKDEIQKIAPSDEEIRGFYELNKTSFVWSDMLKMFLVVVPKAKDTEKARKKANELFEGLKNKKMTIAQITTESKKEKSIFQAGELLLNKNQQSAQQLGVSYAELLELFKKDIGFVSTIVEQDTNFQFYTVIKKYDAKMLALSDIVRPETTTTVYDYVKQSLGQQKQMEFLTSAATEIAKSLDTSGNVERKKTGGDLDKILSW